MPSPHCPPLRKPRGRPAAPRFLLNPDLVRRVRGSGKPLWFYAALAGWSDASTLSNLLSSRSVGLTATQHARLVRLAEYVDHPIDALFEGDAR